MYIHRYAPNPALSRSYDPRSAQGARQAARPYGLGLGAGSPRPSLRVGPDRRAPRHVTRHCGVMARSRGSRRHRRVREAAPPRYLARYAKSHGVEIADALVAAAAAVSGLRLWTLNRKLYPM